MSLPEYKSTGKQSSAPVPSKSHVINLNIGGCSFSTTLGTIQKFPNSVLSDFCCGSTRRLDAEGRIFIDRDGTHFGPVLEFLRMEKLPNAHLQEVHREAQFYGIRPLVKAIEDTPQFFGETVGRQQFLARVPHYRENLEVIMRVARAEAIASRHSQIIVCVLRTEEDLVRYNDAVEGLGYQRESVVTFGPWKAHVSVEDLLDCIRMDIARKGYTVKIEPHRIEKAFLFKSYDFFYKLIFTWW
ncbi:hypothetical protein DNTS_014236 [Danionella cerebrum]|uniref:Uncharacterized protein n=1 Tax=Danionella cerebrum TaxID=2873325 RepID=A0A553RIX7_9TELE|nr:hypothetical protein DNTS_014236 [Danionella translucida]